MLFNRLLCLVFRPFFPSVRGRANDLSVGSACSAPLRSSPSSLELNHVQVIERHKVSITTEDVHVSFRVDNADVSITCCWLGSTNEAKFVFVVCSSVVVVGHSKLLSLFHGLVVRVEAVVSVLDDKRVHHRH